MNTQPTLGEWRDVTTHADEDNAVRVITARDGANGNFAIARVFGPDRKANAHLIASAPELLAACQHALRRLETLLSEETGPCAATEAVRQAIAKATGGTP